MRLDVKNTRSLDGTRLWKTVDSKFETYWSGLDARIFANDVLLDEILVLQYTLQEAVLPLFSYAAYTYDAVMHGARRVQGSFAINYKREAYLFELLQVLKRQDARTSAASLDTKPGSSEAFRLAASQTATVGHFMALAAADGSVTYDASQRPQLDPALMNQVADTFERALWGTPSRSANDGVNRVATEAQGPLSPQGPRFELSRRFDLNVHFGSSSRTQFQPRKLVGYDQVQPYLAPGAEPEVAVETRFRIVGMALTGVERTLDDSGRPILETYSFIARDVL